MLVAQVFRDHRSVCRRPLVALRSYQSLHLSLRPSKALLSQRTSLVNRMMSGLAASPIILHDLPCRLFSSVMHEEAVYILISTMSLPRAFNQRQSSEAVLLLRSETVCPGS